MARVGNLKRYLWYDFTNAVSTLCDPDASGPTGILKDTGWLAVMHGADVPVGATVARIGLFSTSAGAFSYGTNNPGNNCSTAVVITRVNQTTWTVTTDPGPYQTLPSFDGTLVPVGNQSQMKTSAGDFVGNYLMSFGMTVTCPGCK